MNPNLPIGWRLISPKRHRAPSLGLVLYEIQKDYPAAVQVAAAAGFVYLVPAEGGSTVVGLSWPDDRLPYWWFVRMPNSGLALGSSVSIYPVDEKRVRVYPGNLAAPPVSKPVRKPKTTSGEVRLDGLRLRQTRLRLGVTQADLAERIISRLPYKAPETVEQIIARFERGEHIPYPDLLLRAVTQAIGPLDQDLPAGAVDDRVVSLRARRHSPGAARRQVVT